MNLGCYLLSVVSSVVISMTAVDPAMCQVSPLPGSNVMISPVGGGNLAPRALVSADLFQGGSCPTGNLFYNNAGAIACEAPGAGGTGTVTSVGFVGGILSIATPTTTPAITIAGTSGGIPYFSSGTTWASSAALSANSLVLGGGASGPSTPVGLGTATQLLHGNASGAPAFGAISSADVAAVLASPPCIGCTVPGTLADTTSNFADNARSLASFGVDMTGATDTTAAFQTALRSGLPLTCIGTFQVTSLVTVTNIDASLTGWNSVNGCVMLLTTTQSMTMFTETGNALRTSNKIRLEHIKVIPQAAITSVAGATHTAAFDIEYPLGTSGTINPNITVKDVQIQPSTDTNYILNGIYLNDTQTVLIDRLGYEGKRNTADINSHAIVLDGTHSPTTLHITHSLVDFAGALLYAPAVSATGWQGIRVADSDCVFCYYGVNASGGNDGTSDYLDVHGLEGAFFQSAVAVNNVGHAHIHDNYAFLVNPSSGSIANPACYLIAWTVAVGVDLASPDISHNSCDGLQISSFTGNRFAVILGGISNTVLGGTVGVNEASNLDVAVFTPTNTNGVTVAHQSLRTVATEWTNTAAAGNIQPIPPLAAIDGSAQTAGYVGEIIQSTLASGSAVSLANGIGKTVTSVSLTPGDWECYGDVSFLTAAGTTVSLYAGGVSSVNNTLPVQGTNGEFFMATAWATGVGAAFPIGPRQVNISSPTTEYLVAESNFGVSTQAAYGYIECRRMR